MKHLGELEQLQGGCYFGGGPWVGLGKAGTDVANTALFSGGAPP